MTRFSLESDSVPSVNPSGAPEVRQRIDASPDAFGAGIGRALGTLGQGIEKAATIATDIASAHQGKQNEVHAAELGTWLADRITDRHARFATLEGKAAMDALPQYKQDIEGLYRDALQQAPGDSEKAMVAKSGRYLTSRYYGYATEHATRQSRAWADKTATDRAASNANVASIANQNNDPQGMDVALNGSDDEVRKLFEQKGFDQEAINAEVNKNRGRNLQRIIKETSGYDSDAAVKLFFRYAPQMDAQSRADTGVFLKPVRIQQIGKQMGDEALGQTALPPTLNDEIDRAASIAGVDATVLRGVIRIESSANPAAVKGSYKGLGQLSEAQFQKYGGGDIFNTRDNLRATARKLADEAGDFEQKFGRLPTAAEMYLTHQQGAGGFAAHIANPDRPAWQNMLSTKEGQQKGEAWARAAIWGNVPDRDKGRFGSVENITSRQFVQLWEQKVEAATGRVLPDKSEAFSRARDLLHAGEAGPALETATLAYLGRRYSHQEAETALETQRVDGLVKSDLASMLASGRGLDDINPFRVQRALGTAAAQKWSDDRDDAFATWSASHDLPSLTGGQIDERLASIAPKPGDIDFERKQGVFAAVSTLATKLRKQRDIDPAETVRSDPMVKTAAAMAPENPERLRELVEARLAAQSRAGIPPENQSPITQEEAMTFTRPLRTMLPGQEREVLTGIAQKFQNMFGEHADEAFAYALRAHKVDTEVAQVAARLVKKLGLGLLPDSEDARAIEGAAEIGAAQRAVTGMSSGDIAAQRVPGFGMGPDQSAIDAGAAARAAAQKAGVSLPVRAVMDLRANPKLSADFDRKYGAGAAAKILEAYPVR